MIHSDIVNKLRTDKTGWSFGFYIIRAWPFIRTMGQNLTKSVMDIFIANSDIIVSPQELVNWISIAQEYVGDIVLEQQQSTACTHCKSLLYEHTDGEYCCDNCGFIFDTRLPGIKDLESINMCKTYYSLNSNLSSAIDKFEGKDVIVSQLNMQNIAAEISKRQLDVASLKCDHVVKILKDLKLTKHYNDAYFIYMKLTGKPMLNIRAYVPQILALHNELEFAYKFVKNGTRVNSLNVQFKLIKLLGLCDIDQDVSDFCTLKTEQKLEEHEEKWREICKITGWKYN
jgi:uncharacterized Zn finger protein (UPF0148 family)